MSAADDLAVAYQPLAFKIAQRYSHVMPIDELRSEATLILLVVAREFSTSAAECSFATFATYRVQQRLVDYIRSRLGRYGQRGSWETLMLDVDAVYHDDAPPAKDDTEERVLQNELLAELVKAIQALDADLGYIIRKHYIEGQTLKIIAKALGRSESRISQLHRRALSELCATLSASGYGDGPAVKLATPA